MDGYDTPSGRLYHRFLILDATSNLAAAISVPLRNDRETRPEPRFETELILVQFFIPDSTPSIRDVTSASITRSETSLQVQDTEMERDCGDGVYCTSRRGIVARPATAATTKLLEHLMQAHPRGTYLIILGFVAASIPTIFPGVPTGLEWVVCALTLLAGFGVVYKVSHLE